MNTTVSGSGDELFARTILLSCLRQQFKHPLPQHRGRQHLDLGSVLEDVHHELPVILIRDLERIKSLGVERALLGGMPYFAGHPAGAFGGEPQFGCFRGFAGEDAVAAAQFRIQGGLGDIARRGIEALCRADALERETAQPVAPVAPGIEIPVVPVVHEALGRDLAFGFLITGTAVIVEAKTLTRKHSAADEFKVLRRNRTGGLRQDADTFLHFVGGMIAVPEQRPDPLLQGLDIGFHESGLEVIEQVLHR